MLRSRPPWPIPRERGANVVWGVYQRWRERPEGRGGITSSSRPRALRQQVSPHYRMASVIQPDNAHATR